MITCMMQTDDMLNRALKLCSNNCLFENQVRKLKSFMSWNGFPRTIRSLLTSKLKNTPSNTCQTQNNISDENYARPKIWLRFLTLAGKEKVWSKNA